MVIRLGLASANDMEHWHKGAQLHSIEMTIERNHYLPAWLISCEGELWPVSTHTTLPEVQYNVMRSSCQARPSKMGAYCTESSAMDGSPTKRVFGTVC